MFHVELLLLLQANAFRHIGQQPLWLWIFYLWSWLLLWLHGCTNTSKKVCIILDVMFMFLPSR